MFAAMFLSGCFQHRHHSRTEAATGPRQATVEWLGRGCFLVSSSIGLSVLLDPFNPSVTHIPVKVASIPADVVFITHEDEMANYTDLAAGSPQIFRSSLATGVNRASGILVRGVRTSSENFAASARLNVAYVFAMDGVRFCDLGAIEDAITPSEALNLGTVDVLFMPVGGPPNFTDAKRLATIERLRPKVVVPWPFAGGSERIPGQMNVVHLNSNQFTVSPSTLPATTTVYVLGR